MAERAEVAYAVVRLDFFQMTEEAMRAEPNLFVTVREVVPTSEEADREAARLNELNADKGAFYFSAGTHLFPNGRNVQRGY